MRYVLRGRQKWLRIAIVFLLLPIACSELADWIACNMATNPPPGKSCEVLVLGYPANNDGTPSDVQEVRVTDGVSAFREYKCDRLVFSGAAVKNQIVEANTMAQVAYRLGVQSDRVLVETRARTTWENIKFSLPKLEQTERILIVSDSLHAHRGRRYLCKQRPDLCARTFIALRYRPFDRWWRIVVTGHELFAWGRDLLMY
jgi:uncharacterized SAM-binding protein YcdF (DUF218 family)